MQASKKIFFYIALFICIAGALLFWQRPLLSLLTVVGEYAKSAAVFFVPSITVEELRQAYTAPEQKVRILLMPGHEPGFGGSAFLNYTERDIVVDIANELAVLLAQNPGYEVTVARSREAWHPKLNSYFAEEWGAISLFRQEQTALMQSHIAAGRIDGKPAGQVEHNDAPQDAAIRLYGINKWASENNIDITLHLHINDHAGRKWKDTGLYDGFSMYVPDRQYSNAAASKVVALHLARRLAAYHATSTMPLERSGILEDIELIAIGSNNSTDAASVLVEYGYIYERQFREPATRALAVSDYAYQTYLGLQDFFLDSKVPNMGSNVPAPVLAPVPVFGQTSPQIYALQSRARGLGLYPPPGKSLNDCPVSGYFGECTSGFIRNFELAQGLPPTGTFTEETKNALKQALQEPFRGVYKQI